MHDHPEISPAEKANIHELFRVNSIRELSEEEMKGYFLKHDFYFNIVKSLFNCLKKLFLNLFNRYQYICKDMKMFRFFSSL